MQGAVEPAADLRDPDQLRCIRFHARVADPTQHQPEQAEACEQSEEMAERRGRAKRKHLAEHFVHEVVVEQEGRLFEGWPNARQPGLIVPDEWRPVGWLGLWRVDAQASGHRILDKVLGRRVLSLRLSCQSLKNSCACPAMFAGASVRRATIEPFSTCRTKSSRNDMTSSGAGVVVSCSSWWQKWPMTTSRCHGSRSPTRIS